MKVAFSLAFAQDKHAPDTGFFTCQQHYPENFWNPAFQKHANSVTGIAGVVFVAENPADHHVFLKAFAGVTDLAVDIERHHHRDAARRDPGDGRIRLPAALRVEPPDVARGMRLAAIRFTVARHGGGDALRSGTSVAERMGKLVVAPQSAHGADAGIRKRLTQRRNLFQIP